LKPFSTILRSSTPNLAASPRTNNSTEIVTTQSWRNQLRMSTSTESPTTTDSELLVRSSSGVLEHARRKSSDSNSSSARNSVSSTASNDQLTVTERLLFRLLDLSLGRIYEQDFIAACDLDIYLPTVFLKALDRLLHSMCFLHVLIYRFDGSFRGWFVQFRSRQSSRPLKTKLLGTRAAEKEF